MAIFNPFSILGIIGIRPAIWYALYRLQLAGRIARLRTPAGSWDEYFRSRIEKKPVGDPQHQPRFFFDDPRALGEILKRVATGAEFLAKEELEKNLKGSFRLWEDAWHDYGVPPAWNRNPLTGRDLSADRHWTEIDENASGEVKGVWELSRFAVAFRLVRCYALTGDERAPELFWQLVESWMAANPLNCGPQWVSAQEVALRAMAWVFALRGFAGSPATSAERAGRLIGALDAHARRIEATTAYARAQNNNHLISEAAGLFTIGVMFPGLPRAGKWRDQGIRLLAESTAQFYPDGGYIQHSHNYHRLALQLYIWVMRLAELNGLFFPEGMRWGVNRSFDLLRTQTDRQTGRLPNFGHNDGALFLPLNTCACEDYRPLLQMLSLVIERKKIFRDGPWDEDTVWLFGPRSIGGTNRKHPRGVKFEPRPFFAPCAGLYILGGDESQAVIRCVQFRSRPAHADQLHVDLWWRGENIAIDAGSYLYSGEPPWRNSLSHAGVHNNVTVDGQDQMRRSGRFLWTHAAQGVVGTPDVGAWSGSHDGYRRLGVLHNRLVERADEDVWIVTDELAGKGSHSVRLQWLIADYPWEWGFLEENPVLEKLIGEKTALWKEKSIAGLILHTPAGGISLRIWSSRNAKWNLYRAGKKVYGEDGAGKTVAPEIRGWRSLRYASKSPALSLAGIAEGELPIRFVSVWTPLPRGK
ncbi:MAG: alginate lyase family protein [Anaerolineales bacterium]|nr:alginate lyase family protein [Anaerolineales bacterium]